MGADLSGRLSALVVAADRDQTRKRIAALLVASGMPRPLQVPASGAALAQLGLDRAGVLILACGVDVVREMAILRRIRRELPDPAMVVVSPTAAGAGVRRALDAGADAIVFETSIESALAISVMAVVSGQLAVPRDLRASVERPAFSHRERQVLSLVARGLTNNEIGKRLFLSESTIKSHLSSAFAKLGVRSRKEAAALFRDQQQVQSLGLADLHTTTAVARTASA